MLNLKFSLVFYSVSALRDGFLLILKMFPLRADMGGRIFFGFLLQRVFQYRKVSDNKTLGSFLCHGILFAIFDILNKNIGKLKDVFLFM